MSFSLGIALGLAAMACYGAGDFLGAITAKKIGGFNSFLLSHLTIFIPLLAYAFFFMKIPFISPTVFLMILATSASLTVGYLAFLKASEKGVISVIAPISSNWVIVTVLLSMIFLREQLSLPQSAAVLLAVAGITLVSTKLSELRKARLGLSTHYLAFAAMVAWGVEMFLFKPIASSIGAVPSVVLVVIFSFLLALAVLALTPSKRRELAVRARIPLPWTLLALSAFALTVGDLAYNKGISFELASIVAPLAAAHASVTVLLSRVFLKEKLGASQYFGIALIIAAVIMLSA